MVVNREVRRSEFHEEILNRLLVNEECFNHFIRYNLIFDMIFYDAKDDIKVRTTSVYEQYMNEVDVVIEFDLTGLKIDINLFEAILFNELRRITIKSTKSGFAIKIDNASIQFSTETVEKYKDIEYFKEKYGGIKERKKSRSTYGRGIVSLQVWDQPGKIRREDNREKC